MNTMVKGYAGSSSWSWALPKLKISKESITWLTVLGLIVVSAFAVIYVRAVTRQMISDVQSIKTSQTAHIQHYHQLLLEQAAWSTQERLTQTAKKRLNMVIPQGSSLIMVNR